jgi:hypothetical protein
VRIFKSKPFARYAKKTGLADAALRRAIDDASRGLIDADLGGGVIKQRIARDGSGKSGGFRTIILFKTGERAFFVHGFAKNERENIRADELATFKILAADLLSADDKGLEKVIKTGGLIEVTSDDQTIS